MGLHKFNKKRALRRLHFKQNKSKYIKITSLILSIIILITGIIYYTYSKFTISNKFNVIQTKVGDFSASGDYTIAAYIDGTKADNFPAKNDNYTFDKAECTNSATATWSTLNWNVIISNVTSSGTKCNIYFKSSTIAAPELYQGMIPVTYDTSGNVIIADTTKEWYNYANHNWANAVLINCADATTKAKYFDSNMKILDDKIGTTIPLSDILQMYVWIPRYKYLLWNVENGSSDPQAISIAFELNTEAKSTGTKNGEWLTHPAFTFGTTELNGIWVGKFENSGSTTALTIKPNVSSLRSTTVGDMFNSVRNIENTYSANFGMKSTEFDSHMMKNMEWGAVAYLSSSIYGRYSNSTTCISSGCEVWINPNSSYTTGCAGGTVSSAATTACNNWNTSTGVNASTTGNMYGIYDMSGGAWEYVMGNMVDSSGNFYPSSSGLSKPDTKYYNSYAYSASTYTDHARGGIGDATKETLKTFGSETGGWYSDYADLPDAAYSWFSRGGSCGNGAYAGAFYFARGTGEAHDGVGFRSVLSAQ